MRPSAASAPSAHLPFCVPSSPTTRTERPRGSITSTPRASNGTPKILPLVGQRTPLRHLERPPPQSPSSSRLSVRGSMTSTAATSHGIPYSRPSAPTTPPFHFAVCDATEAGNGSSRAVPPAAGSITRTDVAL
eukprot:5265273-Prymnesium_polylepis.2